MTTPTSREHEEESPEERRKILETHGADFVNAIQLQALGEHMEQERQRAQDILKKEKDVCRG